MLQSFSIIFLIAAFFSYVNYKWLKLPSTIGLMILALSMVVLITLTKVSRSYCSDEYLLDTDDLLAQVSSHVIAPGLHIFGGPN